MAGLNFLTCPSCGRVSVEGGPVYCEHPEAEAIEDVVADLDVWWGIPDDVARPVVERFAASGDCNGYSTLADAVTENTSIVVAEWMVAEAMFEGGEA